MNFIPVFLLLTLNKHFPVGAGFDFEGVFRLSSRVYLI